MPEMIAALFAERARAESALQSLLESEIAPDRLVSAGVNEGRQVSSISGFRTLSPSDDFGAALADLQLPPEDMRLFGRGLQRGLTLVAARVDRSAVGDAVRRLEIFDPVDLDRGSREWAEADGVADQTSPLGAGISAGATGGLSNTEALPGMGALGEGTDDLGTADQRADRPGGGLASTVATRVQRDGDRAERPGVNELAGTSPAPDARQGPFQRRLNRGGRVWAYGGVDEGSR